jgi:hypothetical protein
VVEEKEVATYAGLLARAHEEGLKSIRTELIQVPTEANRMVAIAKAEVTTSKGTFSGIGDADPDNVGRRIVPHIIRMAETRAKGRALRDAVNIGVVCLDELGDIDEVREEPRARDPGRNREPEREREPRQQEREPERRPTSPARGQGSTRPPSGSMMTDPQRRLIYRLLAERDNLQGQRATDEILRRLNVNSLNEITKAGASRFIDEVQGAAS